MTDTDLLRRSYSRTSRRLNQLVDLVDLTAMDAALLDDEPNESDLAARLSRVAALLNEASTVLGETHQHLRLRIEGAAIDAYATAPAHHEGEAMTYDMKDALHLISLTSQNGMSSKDECGRIAREALAAEEARESKSWHDEQAEDLQRRREQHALAVRDYEQRFDVNAKLVELSQSQIEDIADVRRFREEEREHRAFHREQTARQTEALEAIAATLIRLTATTTTTTKE